MASLAPGRFYCICCSFAGDSVECVEGHIASEHLKYFPFECFYCQFVRLPTEFFLSQHIKQQHPGQVVKAVYTPEENQKKSLARLLQSSTGGKTTNNTDRTQSIRQDPPNTEDINSEDNHLVISEDVVSSDQVPDTTSEPHSTTSSVEISELPPSEEPKVTQLQSASKSAKKRKRKSSPAQEAKISKSPPRNVLPLSIEKSGKGNTKYQNCAKCNKAVLTGNTRSHVVTVHFDKKTVFCPYCGHSIKGQIANMKRHITSVHKGKPITVLDRRSEFVGEIQRLQVECFGISTPQRAEDSTTGSSTPQHTEEATTDTATGNTAETVSSSRKKAPKEAEGQEFQINSPDRIASALKVKPKSSSKQRKGIIAMNLKPGSMNCVLCNQVVSKANRLGHVSGYHFGKMQLWCGYCDYKTHGNIHNLKQHMITCHRDEDVTNFRDERLKHYEEMRDLVLKCFPGTTPLERSRFIGIPEKQRKSFSADSEQLIEENPSESKEDNQTESNPSAERRGKSLPSEPQERSRSPVVRKSGRNIEHVPWNEILNPPPLEESKKEKSKREVGVPPLGGAVSKKKGVDLDLSSLGGAGSKKKKGLPPLIVESLKERYRHARSPTDQQSSTAREAVGDAKDTEES